MIQIFERKPFDVEAVLVDFDSIEEIVEWCKGRAGKATYRIMGVDSKLPCVVVPVPDRSGKTKMMDALVGQWIVKHKGDFRVYRPAAFNATYGLKKFIPTFLPGDRVQIVGGYRSEEGWIGEVKKADAKLVVVDFPNFSTFGKKYRIDEVRNLSIEAAVEYGKQDVAATEMLFSEAGVDKALDIVEKIVDELGSQQTVGVTAARDFRELSMFHIGQIVTVINQSHAQKGRNGEIVNVDWATSRGCYVYTLDFTVGNANGQEFRGTDLELYVHEIAQ